MKFRVSTCLWTCVLLAPLLCLAACDRGQHPQNIGRLAPVFTVSDAAHTVDLTSLRGRVVLVNFWASWCVPCVEELPSLLALQHQMPNLAVVAISIDQDDSAYRAFLARNHVDLLTVRDPDGRIASLYGTVQIPETYAVDRTGVLQRKFVSAQNWTSPEIVDYLKRLGA
jgi:cytochrome c biogenesis protein CcmG/thiol:disulfide interchange protein DsbE